MVAEIITEAKVEKETEPMIVEPEGSEALAKPAPELENVHAKDAKTDEVPKDATMDEASMEDKKQAEEVRARPTDRLSVEPL